VLAQPDTPYDALVRVMDAVREVPLPPHSSPKLKAAELFPDISIGDAPISTVAKKGGK
jgi:hypothetical protein